MKLIQFLLLLFPYRLLTISSSLSPQEVMEKLSDRFIPQAVVGEDTFWTFSTSYRGHDLSDYGNRSYDYGNRSYDRPSTRSQNYFQIDGPFGNKKFSLNTEIRVLSTSQGSHLRFKLTFSTHAILSTILILGFYGIGTIVFMKFPFWQIILFQELFLYSIIMFNFCYEVEELLKLIKDTLQT